MKAALSLSALVFSLLGIFFVVDGCAPPRRDLAAKEEVQKIEKLDELMWFLATAFDDTYKKTKSKESADLTGDDLAALIVVGQKIPWAAERLTRDKRRCDVLGRYGPHGFMLLLTGAGEAGAAAFCRRLERALREAAEGEGVPLTACFGVAACSAPSATPQGLLRRAEERLEAARADELKGSS